MYFTYDVPGYQSDLATAVNRLYEWSCIWQLQIATEKCFICIQLLTKVKTKPIVSMVLIATNLLILTIFGIWESLSITTSNLISIFITEMLDRGAQWRHFLVIKGD